MSERPQPLKAVNKFFEGKEPWQIVTMTASSVLAIVWAHSLYNARESKFFCLTSSYPVQINNTISIYMSL